MPQPQHYITDFHQTLSNLLSPHQNLPLNIIISGGSILPLFKDITIDPKWHLFISDERLEPPYNIEMAKEYIKAPISPVDEIKNLKSSKEIDLVILGVGEDGHIASLFPEHEVLDSKEWIVYVNDSPKPPLKRVSIGIPVLQEARELIFMVPKKDGCVKKVSGPHCSIISRLKRDFKVYLDADMLNDGK